MGNFDIAHGHIVVSSSGLASILKQLGNSVDRNTRDAADRTHGRTLNKHVEDGDAGFDVELIYAFRVPQQLLIIRHFYLFEIEQMHQ
jgi:hypothetical protein